MHKLAANHESSVKEMTIVQNLTVVHKKKYPLQNQNHHEKYKSWAMPPQSERYIKHKKHDPL
jgi:hypothetical protein